MLNKVILIGRMTRDPELRYTQNLENVPVTRFTLAVDRGYKDANGNRQADFLDCVVWNKRAEFVKQWFTKGMLAIVVGRIQSRNWTDKDGNKRVSVEIVCDEVNFGESKAARDRSRTAEAKPAPEPPDGLPLPDGSDFTELPDNEADVPF